MIGMASVLLAACSQNPKAPVAKQVPYVMEEFGGQRVDPYFWMRLSDEQKNAETPDQQTQDVLDYLQAENDYADAYFKPLKSLQETLYKEMTGRLVPDDASVPYKKGGYTYTTRYESGKDYPIYARTADGQVIINATTGLPEVDDKTHTLGNASWDWTGGFYSTFTYKNFRLSAGFDVKVGADLFSMSMRSAYATGKASGTLAGREEWYRSEENRKAANMTLDEWRAAGKCEGYIVPGMIEMRDEEGNVLGYKQNDIPVNPENYWKTASENAPSMFIYDNSYIKCREITLGYTFPEKWLGKKVQSLSVSFVARNPFIVWKNIPNIDPDSGYNTSGLGLEYGSLPSRRSYGINVNVKF